MANFRYDIKRKSDGVVTHMVFSQDPNPPQENNGWGERSTYDIIKNDITSEIQMEKQDEQTKKQRLLDAVSNWDSLTSSQKEKSIKYILEFLIKKFNLN